MDGSGDVMQCNGKETQGKTCSSCGRGPCRISVPVGMRDEDLEMDVSCQDGPLESFLRYTYRARKFDDSTKTIANVMNTRVASMSSQRRVVKGCRKLKLKASTFGFIILAKIRRPTSMYGAENLAFVIRRRGQLIVMSPMAKSQVLFPHRGALGLVLPGLKISCTKLLYPPVIFDVVCQRLKDTFAIPWLLATEIKSIKYP